MAKKTINFQINFTNKWLYSLITIGVVILLGIGVYADGGTQPNIMGHTAGELDFSGGISGDFVFNDNIKVGSHYFDADDDSWLRIRGGNDIGVYKDLAAGKLYSAEDVYAKGIVIRSSYGYITLRTIAKNAGEDTVACLVGDGINDFCYSDWDWGCDNNHVVDECNGDRSAKYSCPVTAKKECRDVYSEGGCTKTRKMSCKLGVGLETKAFPN